MTYSDWQSGTIDLANLSLNTGGAQGDRFISIEHIIATAHDDTLRGHNGDTELLGGAGNDTLRGGQGVNEFIFNHGADVIQGFTDNVDRTHIDVRFFNGSRELTLESITENATIIEEATILALGLHRGTREGSVLTHEGVIDSNILLDDLYVFDGSLG